MVLYRRRFQTRNDLMAGTGGIPLRLFHSHDLHWPELRWLVVTPRDLTSAEYNGLGMVGPEGPGLQRGALQWKGRAASPFVSPAWRSQSIIPQWSEQAPHTQERRQTSAPNGSSVKKFAANSLVHLSLRLIKTSLITSLGLGDASFAHSSA